MNSRRSAQDLVKPLKAEGYGSTLGNTTMSVDDLRKAINNAAKGDDDAMAVVIARLAPYAWQSAHCLSSNNDTAQAATSQGLVTLVKQISANRGEYDPAVEIVRTTREAISSGVVSQPAKTGFMSRFRAKKAANTNSAKDRRAEIAFAALPDDLRFLLWHLEVRHFTPATVARISGKATREVEDGRRHAALGFRRYYIEAMSRENMSLECSAALDLVPDYASGRLDHTAVLSLESHFEKCPECKETATTLRALEGRLLDAMPAINEAALEAAALALINNFGEDAVVEEPAVTDEAESPVVVEAKEHDEDAVHFPVYADPAANARAGGKHVAKTEDKAAKSDEKPVKSDKKSTDKKKPAAVAAAAAAAVAAPVVLDGKDEAVTAVIDIRDHKQPEVLGFHEDEEAAIETPKRYADEKTWWLRERRRPAVAIGAVAVVLSVVSTALFASKNDSADETANELAVTTTVAPTTTAAPAITETTIAPPVTEAPVAETPATTAAPVAAPTTITEVQRRVVTPTTQRPAPTTTRPPATTAAPTTTTTRPPNFAIVDLPPTTSAPLTTITPPAPQQ